MNDAELDRILSRQDQIQPSSGFVASVMDAVRTEAAAPPPIPFPWKRAVPVLVLAAAALLVVLVAAISVVVRAGEQSSATAVASGFPAISWSFLSSGAGALVGWTGAALLLAFVSMKLSMRMAGARP